MDELAAELAERDARGERFRYRLAWVIAFGSPILAITITTAASWINRTLEFGLDHYYDLLEIANSVLAAIGSGLGAMMEPGGTTKMRVAGTIGGLVFGYLFYWMAYSAVRALTP